MPESTKDQTMGCGCLICVLVIALGLLFGGVSGVIRVSVLVVFVMLVTKIIAFKKQR